ncbi:rod shape-determining protein MreC [Acetivibrio clariflavus]|uniref:Cell shape-determining protein MreC n=1 Tax=Acetivibrio clariflavus (strain DSM 19732 / NBRC 101661 / EBR45) TaxID=720554 RepID=G8LY57_ACECE|nr:rod shape-determining protein MreC [Acetivibrio clariflavus]AEV67788.1 rod shape-determining protein MreC [Acetivibrio clariflavus DSM 19732]
MLRLFKNKIFILVSITIILLIVMGLSSIQNGKINYVGDIFSTILSPFQRFINYSDKKINDFFAHFEDIDKLRKENEVLKQKVYELVYENEKLIDLKIKNEELRRALDIKDQYSTMDMVGANIIAKDMGNWFDIFTIDRGTKDGIEIDYPVVTSNGLVGRVMQTDLFTSKVISIIDEDSSISARLSKTSDLVVVKGDRKLKDQGLCIMNYIPADADVSAGDRVETSGVGGIYPKGILIGTVREVRQRTNELDRYAIIEPVVDFKRLEEVFILKPKTINNNETSEGSK